MLNCKKFRKRIFNTQRIRKITEKNDPQTLFKKCPAKFNQEMTQKRYPNDDLQTLLKK